LNFRKGSTPVIQHSRFAVKLVLQRAATFIVSAIFVFISISGRLQAQNQKDVPEKTSQEQLADASGDWQVSWEGRMGTEQATLRLRQDGAKLSGTFKDVHGLSSVSGTISKTAGENKISFDVKFEGRYPFTTRFNGSASGGKLEGTSQGINVTDGAGAYLGHGGEIVHPEHPWTAIRIANQPAQSADSGSKVNPVAKN
jgi:hypothetical protein